MLSKDARESLRAERLHLLIVRQPSHKFKRGDRMADYCFEWAGTGNCGLPRSAHQRPEPASEILSSPQIADTRPEPAPEPEEPSAEWTLRYLTGTITISKLAGL